MHKRLAVITLLFFSIIATAQHPAVEALLAAPSLKHANISLMVKDLTTNTVVADYRSECLTPPASVMKVITTATALEMFGPNYLYKTRIETDGEVDAAGILHGNVYIVGCGDPTMGSRYLGSSAFLRQWCKKMADKGIKKIEGNVVADISHFDLESVNPFWIWEDIGNYYAPGVFAIAYLDNRMSFRLRGQGNGRPVIVESTDPVIDSLMIVNNLTCNPHAPRTTVYVSGLPLINVRYLTGNVDESRESFTESGDIPNPALLLASDFVAALRENNISVGGAARFTQQRDTAQRQLMFIHTSPTLAEIITHTNFRSDNMYAEHLFRLIGSRGTDVSTQHDAVNNIANYWKQRVPSMQWNNVCDGSGLSPVDRVTAAGIVDLLAYMTNSNKFDTFYNSLPMAGQDGTVRRFLSGTPLEKRVRCKSGTTSRIKSYAGYANGQSGHRYAFAVIIADPEGRSSAAGQHIEKLLVGTCK